MYDGAMKWTMVLEAVLAVPALLAAIDGDEKASKTKAAPRATKQPHSHAGGAHTHTAQPASKAAMAVLHPTKDSSVQGWVKFTPQGDGVEVTAEVTGLTPGKHGFHVHEFGDLSSEDGSSAGGHFNPDGSHHAGPDDEERHAGDLGNLVANEEGKATFRMKSDKLTLDGQHTILGRSIVVHAGEDDLKSQPSGESGARVAVGVIGYAKGKAASPTGNAPAKSSPRTAEPRSRR